MNRLQIIRTIVLIGICGLLTILGSADSYAQERTSLERYIPVQKDRRGVVRGVQTSGNAPIEVVEQLPSSKDERILDLDHMGEIRALAEQYGLFEYTEMNPQLRYEDGDISYWAEQGRAAWDLSLHFLARRLVLLRADQTEGSIPEHGNLSALAQGVYRSLHAEARRNWSSQ